MGGSPGGCQATWWQPAPASAEEFLAGYAQIRCEQQVKAGCATFDLDWCKARTREDLSDRYDPARASNYSAAEGAACLGALLSGDKSAACGALCAKWLDAMDRLLDAGQGPCAASHECDTGLRCIEMVCQSLAGPGESCPGPYACQPGLGCVGGVCVSPKKEGEACKDSEECGLACLQEKCTSPKPPGGSCVYSTDCQSGLYCQQKTCQPQVADGQACHALEIGTMCQPGSVCAFGRCQRLADFYCAPPPGDSGQAFLEVLKQECSAVSGCCQSLGQPAVSLTACWKRVNQQMPPPVEMGVRAEMLAACKAGTFAHCASENSWLANPDPCHHVFTTGKEGAPGETCSIDEDCKAAQEGVVTCENQHCLVRLPGKLGDGHCAGYQPDGISRVCASGSFCDYKNDLCSSWGQYGDACDGAHPCQSGLSCADGHCVGSVGVGGVCEMGDWCQLGLFCSKGKCAEKLATGASCSHQEQCQGSSCVDGLCTGPKQPGEVCAMNVECESNVCVQKHCATRLPNPSQVCY